MSTSSIPHSINLTGDVSSERFVGNSVKHHKYATLEKCNSLVQFNETATRSTIAKTNEPKVNFEWYKQFRRSARVLMKSKSDAARKDHKMPHTNKSVNRNGTIARNHFRGVPGDFLDKTTKRFLLSMTVSTIVFFLLNFNYFFFVCFVGECVRIFCRRFHVSPND